MKNPLTALARLFRRADHPVVTQLYTHAIGRPLMVHPAIGAQVIGAYMSGAVDGVAAIEEPITPTNESHVAILSITGPLVSRPMPGLCDDGPLSYEAIRDAFDRSLADPAVSAIVFRMDSPGGMVSGCFDLTDHIHASRGSKPILAVVDDMAYSACYAMAAACDQVWVSRTGGVGSVGVVAYHLDQSGYDEKMGVKVTPIYAGGHKVDFSPHAPLSDEAKSREQAEVDSLYGMFVEAVAAYRGMDAEAVRATDAMTYTGADAVAIGLATHIGTLRDALASLGASDAERSAAAAAAKAAQDEASARAAYGAVCQAVAAADLSPLLTKALLLPPAGVTPETVDARIAQAKALADICAAAGLPDVAADYVAKNTDIEVARAQLQSAVAEDGAEIVTHIPGAKSGTAGSGIWGETIKKFGG